jgi:hypothetical protein
MLQIKKSLYGHTSIIYNGQEIAKHHLSATNDGTREAFEIPEDISVLNWLQNKFKGEIEAIDAQESEE